MRDGRACDQACALSNIQLRSASGRPHQLTATGASAQQEERVCKIGRLFVGSSGCRPAITV
jgi:hypothetical protein